MKFLFYTVKYFLVTFHIHYFRLLYRFTILIAQNFGIQVMIRSFFKPLFGFAGIFARINGVFVRTILIIICSIFILATVIVGIAFYIVLILFPFWLLYKYTLIGLVFVFSLILLKRYHYHHQPISKINNFGNINEYYLSSGYKLRRAFKLLMKNDIKSFLDLIREYSYLEKYLIRMELNIDDLFNYLNENSDKYDVIKFKEKIIEINSEIQLTHITSELLIGVILIIMDEDEVYLNNHNLSKEDVFDSLVFNKIYYHKEPMVWDNDYKLPPSGGVDKGWAISYTGELNKNSKDLTKYALKGFMPKRIGRSEVKDQAIAVLSKHSRNNLMLLGEAGSGKTTFVKALARDIALGTDIKSLKYKRLVELDTGLLTSGEKGTVQEKLSKIIKEIEISKNIILFIDEIHNLSSVQSSDPNASLILSTLQPHIAEGRFQVIGTTSRLNYNKYLSPNTAFANSFDIVELRETDYKETLMVSAEIIKRLESKTGNMITFPAVKNAYKLSDRYINDRAFPDKTIEIIQQGFVNTEKLEDHILNADDIAKVLSETINIPVHSVEQSEKDTLLNLEQRLHERVIGQDDSVALVADAIKRARVGVRDEKRPIASFIFAGPTGVGKTETARALSELYFGSESNMIRVDMSEYNTSSSLVRLIGDGNNPGYLTSKIKARPFSLILLDEIEKADKSILNLFLQVLDEGRLTDTNGLTYDFTNTIIISTTNVGTREITRELSDYTENDRDEIVIKIENALKDYYPPEFLNRFTGLIPYHPLSKEDMAKITKIKIKNLEKRLEDKKIKLEYDDDFITYISNKGYSAEWGARPLNRVIESLIETQLADDMIRGTVKNGSIVNLNNYIQD